MGIAPCPAETLTRGVHVVHLHWISSSIPTFTATPPVWSWPSTHFLIIPLVARLKFRAVILALTLLSPKLASIAHFPSATGVISIDLPLHVQGRFLQAPRYIQLEYLLGSPICPTGRFEDRGASVSISVGGNRAKSLLTNASMHWSGIRVGPSVPSWQKTVGTETLTVEVWVCMDWLSEKTSKDAVTIGASIDGATKFNDFAAESLIMANIEHIKSLIWCLGFQINAMNDERSMRDHPKDGSCWGVEAFYRAWNKRNRS